MRRWAKMPDGTAPTRQSLHVPKQFVAAFRSSKHAGRKPFNASMRAAGASDSDVSRLSSIQRRRNDLSSGSRMAVEAMARASGRPLQTDPKRHPDWMPLKYRLERFKEGKKRQSAERAILDRAKSQGWSKTFTDRAVTAHRSGLGHHREANAATLEAITRHAKKRGWGVRHTSAGKDGRASSRYVQVPGRGEVRVSDHSLPSTPQREAMRSERGPRWSGEVHVGNHSKASITRMMRLIALASGGRYSDD